MNQAQFENGIFEQNVSHLQRELERKTLEAPDELQINNVTQQATQQNPEKPKPTCHHFRKPKHYWSRWRQLKRDKNKAQNNTISAGNNNNKNHGSQNNSNSHKKISNNTNANKTNNQ